MRWSRLNTADQRVEREEGTQVFRGQITQALLYPNIDKESIHKAQAEDIHVLSVERTQGGWEKSCTLQHQCLSALGTRDPSWVVENEINTGMKLCRYMRANKAAASWTHRSDNQHVLLEGARPHDKVWN